MKASELRCSGAAQKAAEALERQFPGIDFTSGRRGVLEQARAMSQNVIRNRKWIAQTYLANAESRALQDWIDDNPGADTAGEIAGGLAAIMSRWTDEQRGKVSRHFSGQAWDVRPVSGPQAAAIKAAIRKLPGLQKFIDKEGGLVRWHAQFG